MLNIFATNTFLITNKTIRYFKILFNGVFWYEKGLQGTSIVSGEVLFIASGEVLLLYKRYKKAPEGRLRA